MDPVLKTLKLLKRVLLPSNNLVWSQDNPPGQNPGGFSFQHHHSQRNMCVITSPMVSNVPAHTNAELKLAI